MFVIFDLDGTLANAEHRVHHLTGAVKDWRAFYAGCEDDDPVLSIVAVLKALSRAKHRVEIWTGRSDEVREQTERWLHQHADRLPIRMRPAGDHRPDTELKAEWLATSAVAPDLVFEDRASVVAMWRSHGIVCAQVAPGEF